VPMRGGEAAIVKPYRMALGYLCALLGEGALSRGLPFLSQVDGLEIDLIKKQVGKGVNSPLTSSCGRLFDAVSAIAGIRSRIEYEAQAAIELEMIAFDDMDKPNLDCYPFSIVEQQGIKVIELGELISAVVQDAENMVAQPTISVKFHQTIAQIVVRMCQLIASERGLNLVALSGGVFQNRLLLRLVTRALNEAGFDVLAHRLVPCNDGGLSLGQAVIAHFATSGVEK